MKMLFPHPLHWMQTGLMSHCSQPPSEAHGRCRPQTFRANWDYSGLVCVQCQAGNLPGIPQDTEQQGWAFPGPERAGPHFHNVYSSPAVQLGSGFVLVFETEQPGPSHGWSSSWAGSTLPGTGTNLTALQTQSQSSVLSGMWPLFEVCSPPLLTHCHHQCWQWGHREGRRPPGQQSLRLDCLVHKAALP